jgi:hypothetical protein
VKPDFPRLGSLNDSRGRESFEVDDRGGDKGISIAQLCPSYSSALDIPPSSSSASCCI